MSLDVSGSRADILPFHGIDAQQLTADFWNRNRAEIRGKVAQSTYLGSVHTRISRQHPNYSREDFNAHIEEGEREFGAHILTRLADILNNAQRQHNLDANGLVLNIPTSMLYDVDHTLVEDREIRPAAIPLLRYIREHFKAVVISLLTTRDKEFLDKQVVDPTAKGSLTEIMPYVNGGAHVLYAADVFVVNESALDGTIYPGWQPINTPVDVLQKMGMDPAQIQDLLERQMPVWERDTLEYHTLELPQLWLNTMMKMIGCCEKLGLAWEQRAFVEHALNFEVLKRTRVIATFIDDHGVAGKDEFIAGLANEIAQSDTFPFTAEQRLVLEELAKSIVGDSFDMLADIEDKLYKSHNLIFPPEVTTTVGKLEYAAQQMLILTKTGYSKATFLGRRNYHDGSNGHIATHRLERHVFNKGADYEIESPEFVKAFESAEAQMHKENRKCMDAFIKKLILIVGEAAAYHSMIQRVAACKRQLESGAAQVSIAIDNHSAAAKYDALFKGELKDEHGEVIDACELFGFPPEWKGRIFIIHCKVEFERDAISKRLEAVLAAA